MLLVRKLSVRPSEGESEGIEERSESVTERVDEEEWSVAECSRSETGVDWFTERSPWRGGVEERSESATGIKKGRGCAGERVSE